jgi:hypothetical protein
VLVDFLPHPVLIFPLSNPISPLANHRMKRLVFALWRKLKRKREWLQML